MTVAKAMGLPRLAWSLRRLHCPVSRSALVLEVGSGGNPYPRSNVLLDGFEETMERVERELVHDRPLVLGAVERLPFKDKSFDFVIASHILEHTGSPELFLSEVMRVGKAGYIETPDAFFERVNPFTYHRLEVAERAGGGLSIFKKPSWRHANEVVDMYEAKLKGKPFLEFASTHPEPFYTRFYWQDRIDFEIVNPEVNAWWEFPPEVHKTAPQKPFRAWCRDMFLGTARSLFSQNARNKGIDIFALLRCPSCGCENLRNDPSRVHCVQCRAEYEVREGVPRMFAAGK